ncbi:MAG: 50S ribosomal protein L21 [Actinomycetota bacterium]|nr:50S ribosomal protein L21 [Actinomycetota bacterium]
MTYAIISLGGKQYRVQEGQKLLVDRVRADEGKTFNPAVLLLAGDGDVELSPKNVTVTARVVGHVLGEKIRIGKYRPKTGYRKHTGYRSRLSRIEIEAIGGAKRAPAKPAAAKAEAKPTEAAPAGYEGLKVGDVADWAKGKSLGSLETALAYEQEHGARKGATAALEAAIAKRKEGES